MGFVFYPPSPRHVEIETARYLCSYLPDHVTAVGLFVNPTDQDIEAVLNELPLGMIQLHGNEPPERVQKIKDEFKLPVMKALPIVSKENLSKASTYDGIADWLLFDSPPFIPPVNGGEMGGLPGGNGIAFDWSILEGYSEQSPWMLAGGLTPQTVAEAMKLTNPYGVDVSSGVENIPGVKSIEKIRSFIQAVKEA